MFIHIRVLLRCTFRKRVLLVYKRILSLLTVARQRKLMQTIVNLKITPVILVWLTETKSSCSPSLKQVGHACLTVTQMKLVG